MKVISNFIRSYIIIVVVLYIRGVVGVMVELVVDVGLSGGGALRPSA